MRCLKKACCDAELNLDMRSTHLMDPRMNAVDTKIMGFARYMRVYPQAGASLFQRTPSTQRDAKLLIASSMVVFALLHRQSVNGERLSAYVTFTPFIEVVHSSSSPKLSEQASGRSGKRTVFVMSGRDSPGMSTPRTCSGLSFGAR